ncbi:hypothetical protein [Desulfotalea psychrophila]|uniref:Related to two-component system response regulator n=1 Tax=Desulfotalea psychrophila (strain LSv54 / DSM 12343) TaxID=177439 RepID=Q6ARF8_DESPS|nr:hypothetical protein [Desulfotalea psychrophila]CAG35067.1 related to two-component system response regulator [Desulfotalea psychrophila LSv54]
MDILLLDGQEPSFLQLKKSLAKNEKNEVTYTSSSTEAKKIIGANKAAVVLIAENLDSQSGLDFAKEIVPMNPFINYALQSSLPSEKFHDVTEGYGLFMQLPLDPGAEDAEQVTQIITKIHQI